MPRSVGEAQLTCLPTNRGTVIENLRHSGALRLVFPKTQDPMTTIAVNTAGGLTSGDRMSLECRAKAGAQLVVSTQAAERAYRAERDFAEVRTVLAVEDNAQLHWLPQELILFDGCRLRRQLRIDLAPSARLLMVEPVIFGRAAMGEQLSNAQWKEHIAIYRNSIPLYLDRTHLCDDVQSLLGRRAVAQGANAMASLVYVGPDAEARLMRMRNQAMLPPLAGASLLEPNTMVARILAEDGFSLRQALLPLLDWLSNDTLPKTWRL